MLLRSAVIPADGSRSPWRRSPACLLPCASWTETRCLEVVFAVFISSPLRLSCAAGARVGPACYCTIAWLFLGSLWLSWGRHTTGGRLGKMSGKVTEIMERRNGGREPTLSDLFQPRKPILGKLRQGLSVKQLPIPALSAVA